MTAPTTHEDRYPTRGSAPPAIRPRRDPIVWGDDPGPLDPELLATFEEVGYLVLPGLLPPTAVTSLRQELDRLCASDRVRDRPQAVVEPDGDELRSLFQTHLEPGPLRQLAEDPALVGMARQLLGDRVYIHQSRVNLKPGLRGREFSWHSDFETWHSEDGMPSMRAVSCSVLLTHNHTSNGPLLVIDGSHHWFVGCTGTTPPDNFRSSLRRQTVGVPDDRALEELVARGGISECTGPPGTVVLFDCNLMHGSNGNITPWPRHNVFIVYNSVENSLGPPYAASEPRPEFIATRAVRPL